MCRIFQTKTTCIKSTKLQKQEQRKQQRERKLQVKASISVFKKVSGISFQHKTKNILNGSFKAIAGKEKNQVTSKNIL